MCNIKFFPYPQDEKFYSLMGRFFADRGIIKELDNQLYNDDKTNWYVYIEKKVIKGFVSVQEKADHNYIDNFYVLEAFRDSTIGGQLLDKTVDSNRKTKTITRNVKALKMFINRGFEEKRRNGRYYYLEKSI